MSSSPLLSSSYHPSSSFLLSFSSPQSHHRLPPPSIAEEDLHASVHLNPPDLFMPPHHLFDSNVPLSLDMVASIAASAQSQIHGSAVCQASEETQITTPTMHPNLVSTLKSIICPFPSSPQDHLAHDQAPDASSSPPSPAQYGSPLDSVSAQYGLLSSSPSPSSSQYGPPLESISVHYGISSSSSSSLQGNALSFLSLEPLFAGSDQNHAVSVEQKRKHHQIDQKASDSAALRSLQAFFNAGDPAAVSADLQKLAQKQSMEQKKQCASIVPIHLIQNRRPYRCGYGGCLKTFKNPQTLRMHHKTHCSGNGGNNNGSRSCSSSSSKKKNSSGNRKDLSEGDGDGAAPASGEVHHHSLATVPPSLKAGQNKKIPSRCPLCKRAFVGLYELRRHFGRKHSEGEKAHACSKCGKRFYIEVDLRDHQKLCGEPLVCSCGMKFAFKCNLVAHRKKKTHPLCHPTQLHLQQNHHTPPPIRDEEHQTRREDEQQIPQEARIAQPGGEAIQEMHEDEEEEEEEEEEENRHSSNPHLRLPSPSSSAAPPQTRFIPPAMLSDMAGSSQSPDVSSIYSSSPPNPCFLPPHCSPFHPNVMKSEQLQCNKWLASTSAL